MINCIRRWAFPETCIKSLSKLGCLASLSIEVQSNIESGFQSYISVLWCNFNLWCDLNFGWQICRDDLHEAYDAYDDGIYCRARSWLFISYCISFGAIVGAVWVLLSDYALKEGSETVWPGVAGLFQVTLILGSALLFFVSRTPSDDSGGYSQW